LRAGNPDDFNHAVARYSKELPNAHLTWRYYLAALDIAEAGGIEWPPRTDYLVGIETKYLYLDPKAREINENTVKSRKSSPSAVRRIRLKLEHLAAMGLDKVALLEFIGNPPASGVDSRTWSIASNIASASENAMAPVFKKRLPANSIAGHWVCSIGAVAAGDETMRGSGGTTEYHPIRDNPWSSDPATTSRRAEMQKNLHAIFSKFPKPRSFPALYINCKPCGNLHRSFLEDPCNAFYNATRHGLDNAKLG
jgi:hypothetical protein